MASKERARRGGKPAGRVISKLLRQALTQTPPPPSSSTSDPVAILGFRPFPSRGKVVTNGRYVSPALAEKLASDMGGDTDRPLHDNLSAREFQVMRLLAAGRTVKEIAADLALSVKTVSTYRTRILDKLSLRTNAKLIHYAIQHQLVE